jgi:hypothetical protein
MNRMFLFAGAALWLGGLIGCSSGTSAPETEAVTQLAAPASVIRDPSPEGAKYRLDAEPAGAQEVIAVRADAADGDEIVVVGRIGGDVNPWVAGRAAFTIVDQSVDACSDIPGDSCPTPWDYCCRTDQLKTGKLLVKFVDESGNLIASDAQELLGLGELDTVVIQGTVEKSEDGATVLLATAIYVRSAGIHAADDDHDHDHGHVHDHEHGEEGHAHEGEST